MPRMTCEKCGKPFSVADAKMDKNWDSSWSWEPAGTYCPHCEAPIKHLHPDTVDLVRHINAKNIFLFIAFNALWLLGLATNTVHILGPIGLLVISAALITKAKRGRHRVFGWVLLLFLAGTLFFVNAYA